MHSQSDNPSAAPAANCPRLAAFEVAWIFLIFFLYAGSLPPDVGESHYLVKAKHYWQPDWCAGDLFLESRDAHATFYWTFGWVTKFCSLEATAWIGRIVTWLLLAWSWQRLSWVIIPRQLVSLLSAGLMLFFLHNFHMAGEWIVGGVEAKGFAYVLVFLSLEAIARNNWPAALLLAGAAGAFHVLVGGWLAVALGLAWLASRDRPRLISLLPAAVGGLLLALPGLIPALALNWGVEKEIVRESARIYVFDRLSHHLVFHSIEPWNISRFQLLLIAWVIVSWLLRKQPGLARLQCVAAATFVFALIGVLIDQAAVLTANFGRTTAVAAELTVAPLLRYYWFRLSDSLVPISLSLAIVCGLALIHDRRPIIAFWLTVVAAIFPAATLASAYFGRSKQNVPPAILQPRPTADSWRKSWFARDHQLRPGEVTADQWFRDWKAACDWIAAHSPPDAAFLTPREQQTFKWYAGRPEIVNWKDVPQDARGLIEWNRRFGEIYPSTREHHRYDLAAFTDAELVALAQKYSADYIVIDRTRANRRLGLPRLYPSPREENASFEVYRVPRAETP